MSVIFSQPATKLFWRAIAHAAAAAAAVVDDDDEDATCFWQTGDVLTTAITA